MILNQMNGPHYQNNKIYVGGGKNEATEIEYYDINKNEWYSLSNTNYEHLINPINIIYIASTWSTTFEKMDVRQNKWHSYIPVSYTHLTLPTICSV